MKQYLLVAVAIFTLVGCGENIDKSTAQYIKGHTFSQSRTVGVLEFTFNKDMSVAYKWQNTWEKESHTRKDLRYEILNDVDFAIYTTDNDEVWGNGSYHTAIKPFILLDNFQGDTLYVK